MPVLTLVSFDAEIKDRYPRPGERIKQYVVDERREEAWEAETCPFVFIEEHDDNTGMTCGNVGDVQWRDLESHHCCSTCGGLAEATFARPDVALWRGAKAMRPPICPDRSKLSEEIATFESLVADNPLFKLTARSA